MTANHVEHEIATFPGSPGRGGQQRPAVKRHFTNAGACSRFSARPIDKESMKAPVVRPGLVGENTSRGVLDAPILSQSVRRAIIRKHETRNQKD
jgi:hypothetical protein